LPGFVVGVDGDQFHGGLYALLRQHPSDGFLGRPVGRALVVVQDLNTHRRAPPDYNTYWYYGLPFLPLFTRCLEYVFSEVGPSGALAVAASVPPAPTIGHRSQP